VFLDVYGEQCLLVDKEVRRETDLLQYALKFKVYIKHTCMFGGRKFLIDELELD